MEKTKKKLKTYSRDEAHDVLFGKKGTPNREDFENEREYEVELYKLMLKLKEIRNQKGLTQTELGEALGVKKGQISKIESGDENVTIGTIRKVSNALGAKVSFVVKY